MALVVLVVYLEVPVDNRAELSWGFLLAKGAERCSD
jgi:hypothetical protein